MNLLIPDLFRLYQAENLSIYHCQARPKCCSIHKVSNHHKSRHKSLLKLHFQHQATFPKWDGSVIYGRDVCCRQWAVNVWGGDCDVCSLLLKNHNSHQHNNYRDYPKFLHKRNMITVGSASLLNSLCRSCKMILHYGEIMNRWIWTKSFLLNRNSQQHNNYPDVRLLFFIKVILHKSNMITSGRTSLSML